ncbi:LLM class flavin-dependent oxidoreductase [Paenibacillus glycinis]|uniref:MsnO8 family LLM class oxidoreductase n=1 Tax=Paenibacillus glycinis TaxID=2697035 RepID=A0ABW9XQN4_9BACL|nr:LLM class flavin-dependent oxidoreductase [Paenibacillus glycinis]NBD24958.1 MsnO8 family LLM class oxidoreductase [Paenibacillus glycinis]
MLKLGILDQSLVGEGHTAIETLAATTRLAIEADTMGYSRYWVSEHHGSKGLAHSSPEVLIGYLASHTNRIRVGSGGIMMPHYSAYKVAENFKLLEALYPGRIDLGIGHATGSLPLATSVLQEGRDPENNYSRQVGDLVAYLHDAMPANHRFPELVASPSVPTAPELWLLGSSGKTAELAAEVGASYAFAHFIIFAAGGPEATALYRERFKPTLMKSKSQSLAAVIVICADTEEEARKLDSSVALYYQELAKGKEIPFFPTVETAERYPYTEDELEKLKAGRAKRVVGNPEQVKQGLTMLAEEYQAHELLLLSPIHDVEARLRSYRLLAKAFGMQ